MLCDAVGDAVASACARSIPERFPNTNTEAIMAAREATQHARFLYDDCIQSPLKATAHATWHLHPSSIPMASVHDVSIKFSLYHMALEYQVLVDAPLLPYVRIVGRKLGLVVS